MRNNPQLQSYSLIRNMNTTASVADDPELHHVSPITTSSASSPVTTSNQRIIYTIAQLHENPSLRLTLGWIENRLFMKILLGKPVVLIYSNLSLGSGMTSQEVRRNLTHSRCPSAAAR